jgi:hypothetical protein
MFWRRTESLTTLLRIWKPSKFTFSEKTPDVFSYWNVSTQVLIYYMWYNKPWITFPVECALYIRKLKLQLSRTFLCKLSIGNSMVSREMWININTWVFQRPQIALVFQTRAIFRSLKNSLMHVISKLHSKPYYYLYRYSFLYIQAIVLFHLSLNLICKLVFQKCWRPCAFSMKQDWGVHTFLKITTVWFLEYEIIHISNIALSWSQNLAIATHTI